MINLELIDSSVIRNWSHCFLKVKSLYLNKQYSIINLIDFCLILHGMEQNLVKKNIYNLHNMVSL